MHSHSTDLPSLPQSPAMACTSEAWCAYPWRDGLQVPSLAPLDHLLVRTRNSLYEVIVQQPCRARVLVRGGRFFPEFTRASVAGSSLGGSFLKLHGIYVGFRLELCAAGRAIITSPVQEISHVVDRDGM